MQGILEKRKSILAFFEGSMESYKYCQNVLKILTEVIEESGENLVV